MQTIETLNRGEALKITLRPENPSTLVLHTDDLEASLSQFIILHLKFKSKKNSEIAEELGCAVDTVKNHLYELRNRNEATNPRRRTLPLILRATAKGWFHPFFVRGLEEIAKDGHI